MTDPISDFLTRLRNASKARLENCVIPHSKLKENILGILKAEGYVADFSKATDAQGHPTLVAKMKYVAGAPAITGLTRAEMVHDKEKLYELGGVMNGLVHKWNEKK